VVPRLHTYCHFGSCAGPLQSAKLSCPEQLGGGFLNGPARDGNCVRPATLAEEVNRDDLMFTGFVPEDYGYPFTLTITQVEGSDYDAGRICPPHGWDTLAAIAASEANATLNWKPPLGQDLFFALTELEPVDHVEDDLPFWVFMGVLVVLCLGLVAAIPACKESCCCHGEETKTSCSCCWQRRNRPHEKCTVGDHAREWCTLPKGERGQCLTCSEQVLSGDNATICRNCDWMICSSCVRVERGALSRVMYDDSEPSSDEPVSVIMGGPPKSLTKVAVSAGPVPTSVGKKSKSID